MSLRIYNDLEQRSPEWYDVRRGILTASVVGSLITPRTLKPANNDTSRGITATLVAERITGWTEETYESFDMTRGRMDEPIAREVYAKAQGVELTEVGFMVRTLTNGARLGYSPDALVGSSGLIEIKSRMPREQVRVVLGGEVPAEHMAQVQAGLFVTGRAWCDYVSFCGGMPLWTKRVHPDEGWHDVIAQVVTRFEETAAQMVADFTAAVEGLPATERQTYYQDAELKL